MWGKIATFAVQVAIQAGLKDKAKNWIKNRLLNRAKAAAKKHSSILFKIQKHVNTLNKLADAAGLVFFVLPDGNLSVIDKPEPVEGEDTEVPRTDEEADTELYGGTE